MSILGNRGNIRFHPLSSFFENSDYIQWGAVMGTLDDVHEGKDWVICIDFQPACESVFVCVHVMLLFIQ